MNRSLRPLHLLALVFGLLAILSGCVSDGNGGRADNQWFDDGGPLDNTALHQLNRFHNVYRVYADDPDNVTRLGHFDDAFRQVRATFVEEVSDASLIDAAVKGVRDLKAEPHAVPAVEVVEAGLDAMLESLDSYSNYFNAEEWRDYHSNARNEFGGLGIRISVEEGKIKVVSPIEDTPAARAGLKAGDLITHVDGQSIAEMKLVAAVRRMRGRPGTSVRLTVHRAGVGDFDVTIVRAIIAVKPVEWRVETDVAYIRIKNFNEKSAQGIFEAFIDLRKQLNAPPKGLVLDLRNNPGGMLDQSLLIADAFLDDGTIVSTRGRRGTHFRAYNAESGDLMDGRPIVVLINSGSASASEIVAGALQDLHRATIMGSRSYGKGAVQTLTRLPLEGGLKLTTAKYFLPSERTIHEIGVEPDIFIDPAEPGPPPNTPAMKGKDKAPRMANVFHAMGRVAEQSCPAAGPKQDDRELGCALELIRSGSADRFLAERGTTPAL